jgi:predicted RNA binding protein YcfA (HicA-like mRNA interferase family)
MHLGHRPSSKVGWLMAVLPVVTCEEARQALVKDGWYVLRIGKHIVMRHPTKSGRPLIPNHPSQTVKPGTLRSILHEAGLSTDQFRDLL